MLSFHMFSGGFISVSLDTANFHVEPALFFGWAGSEVRAFYNDYLRLDFRSLYVDFGGESCDLTLGRFLPSDTGALMLEVRETGYDGFKLNCGLGPAFYTFTFLKGRSWQADGKYYFNPEGIWINEGDLVDRYLLLRKISYGPFYMAEITVLATLKGYFPDISALNPLLSGYLYQWLKGKEVNVLWEIGFRWREHVLRFVVDDFPYLPSWFSIVPPTVGVRGSGRFGYVAYDVLWISAFTYANRRPWDALFEAINFSGDYAHVSLEWSSPMGSFIQGGLWVSGRYNGTFREPEVGDYPPFAFVHSPMKRDGWIEIGFSKGDLKVGLGYGRKPYSLSIGRIFIWFAYDI
ncbi:MAG: hypothetical protein GXO39_04130 [Thermotogae bacterium]|nr:hypothetical protein [Thermotogota bacterium]